MSLGPGAKAAVTILPRITDSSVAGVAELATWNSNDVVSQAPRCYMTIPPAAWRMP